MPSALTYPGVYIEELPSGSHTITGVSTSVTAFLGRSLKGPVHEPVVINSFADFERNFGGLWADSKLGYAVRDFYLNGGSQAVIVRLYSSSTSGIAAATVDTLNLAAANEGTWANNYGARVEAVDTQFVADVAASLGVTSADLFKLVIYKKPEVTGQPDVIVETYPFLTVVDSARRVDKVLAQESKIFRVSNADVTTIDIPEYDENATIAYATGGSDGTALNSDAFLGGTGATYEADKQGLFALLKADIVNLLCIPPYTSDNNVEIGVINAAIKFCEDHRIFYIMDAPATWTQKSAAVSGISNVGVVGKVSTNAAIFFPRIKQPNPLHGNQIEEFVPCGAIAGTFARTDAQRGIWKAPAGTDAGLSGIAELTVPLTDAENGELNPLGVNCLRSLSAAGNVIWGARTRMGSDRLSSEWKYIPVRRLALYIEESLYRGMQWAVFEPNDEPLWRQISLNIDGFMNNLFRQGAFQGSTVKEAYFVKCNKETTTQDDINSGIVNILVGFAPLKPAEFVVIKLQQIAGQPQA